MASASASASDPTSELARWPDAPRQRAPWPLPDATPFTRAVAWHFDHGLPDPRGLAYVRARIVVGELWSGSGTEVEAHGWRVVSAGPGGRDLFLGWNGVLYEPVSIAGDADLDADLAPRPAPSAGSPELVGVERTRGGESAAVAFSQRSAIARALLLRLGRPLAAAPGAPPSDPQSDPERDARDALSTEVAWALFDRAVCAHMRGDDRATLWTAGRLLALRDALAALNDSEANHRPPLADAAPPPTTAPSTAPEVSAIAFARPVDDLHADARRRLLRGPRGPSVVDEHARAASPAPDDDARARALIDELDEVNARQFAQPGGVDLASDPRVAALVRLGDAAVEPLIDALERDARLTRSVHFWRDFSHHRQPLFAHEAAYVALANLLEEDFFRTVSTGDDLSARGPAARVEIARRIRAHWARVRGLSPVERAYAVLADDAAEANRWAQAAGTLTRDEASQVRRGSMFGTGWVTTQTGGSSAPPRLVGEPLRASRPGALTALLRRRAESLLARAAPGPGELTAACMLGNALATWEPSATGLDALTARWMALRTTPSFDHDSCIAALLDARDRAGDARAVREYAAWLPRVSNEAAQYSAVSLLALASRHTEDPRVQRATASVLTLRGWFFAQQAPSWLGEALRSPLGRLPALRAYVTSRLRDRSPVGTLTVERDRISIAYANGGAMGGVESAPLAVTGRWPWRSCDESALALVTDSERRTLWAPPAARDEVIARLLRSVAP